ncbi:MAG: hypothetical protein E2586_01850 [Novosphingobium sp.]|uniref:ABC-three component system middle component 1 n=1 Tax=Novosphingobium sp. TaxID=1874826 RepID=UPI0012BDBA29|nr:ABC-three component system middle component 1 [Novosphingobium sp.]MPS67227.1 hypothetical protein [Novosphingobium sp.]
MSDEFERPMQVLEAFCQRLMEAAAERALSSERIDQIVSTTFRGGGESEAASIKSSDLPASSIGLKVGRYTLILGLLPETPSLNAIQETIRRYRNQCVIARSYLSVNEALDLQLLLVGPMASETSPDWQAAALMVERDDRVARKLIWLRPDDAANLDPSFEDFLGRTFLARPWFEAEPRDPVPLDQLSTNDAVASSVPRNTADAWDAIALLEDEDPFRIVDAVVDAWAKRGAS